VVRRALSLNIYLIVAVYLPTCYILILSHRPVLVKIAASYQPDYFSSHLGSTQEAVALDPIAELLLI
jgi:hypothetical protein